MITRKIDDNTISVIAGDADDLLNLRRIIKAGDRITSDTTRVIKRDREYARPDRGERTRVRISLHVERIFLDSTVDRLRISGTILESSNDSIPRGSHHSMLIRTACQLAIYKKRWSDVERRLAAARNNATGFILVAIDRSECGIGRLDGTHLDIMPNIYSGAGGKRYKTSFNMEGFFRVVNTAMISVTRKGDRVIVFGPGETRKKFVNYAAKSGADNDIRTIDGIDTGGEDGIHIFTRSEMMKGMMSDSKIAMVAGIIDSVMAMAGRQSKRFTMGFEETSRASQSNAVESLVFADRILEVADEGRIVDLLNDAESKGARIFGVDSSTDLGLRVAGLGGIISTLRFAVEA